MNVLCFKTSWISLGVMNFFHSWVPTGSILKMYSAIRIAPNQDAIVRFGIVIKIDPPVCRPSIHCIYSKILLHPKNYYICMYITKPNYVNYYKFVFIFSKELMLGILMRNKKSSHYIFLTFKSLVAVLINSVWFSTCSITSDITTASKLLSGCCRAYSSIVEQW